MTDWEVPEPKWLVPELDDDYHPEPFTPEPTAGEIMAGSSIMDRLDPATIKEIMRRVV